MKKIPLLKSKDISKWLDSTDGCIIMFNPNAKIEWMCSVHRDGKHTLTGIGSSFRRAVTDAKDMFDRSEKQNNMIEVEL